MPTAANMMGIEQQVRTAMHELAAVVTLLYFKFYRFIIGRQ
jgi:hypothetical protein